MFDFIMYSLLFGTIPSMFLLYIMSYLLKKDFKFVQSIIIVVVVSLLTSFIIQLYNNLYMIMYNGSSIDDLLNNLMYILSSLFFSLMNVFLLCLLYCLLNKYHSKKIVAVFVILFSIVAVISILNRLIAFTPLDIYEPWLLRMLIFNSLWILYYVIIILIFKKIKFDEIFNRFLKQPKIKLKLLIILIIALIIDATYYFI